MYEPQSFSGDSGGPLSVEQRRASGTIRRELIGVISTLGVKDCREHVPDKYVAVAKYLDWIKQA